MDSLKKAVSSLKDRIVKTPLERSVIEVCSDENWGSANTVLHEISEKTFNHEDRQVIMKLIWELLKSPSKEWRRLYKVLNLIDHLIKFGSTACLHEIQDEAFKIRMLQDFSFREGSEEKGIGVRDKAKYISSMLSDRKVLDDEREKAKKTWSKFSGFSSGDSYSRNDRRGNYDSYPERRVENSFNDRRQDDRYSGRREEPEVKDIFKEPEIKVVKLQPKETLWDREPGKLPTAPKLKPPTSSGVSNIFEPVTVKKVSEVNQAKTPYDPNSPFTQEPLFTPAATFPSTTVNPPSFTSTGYTFSPPAFPSNPAPSNPSGGNFGLSPSFPSTGPSTSIPHGVHSVGPSNPVTSGVPSYSPYFPSAVFSPSPQSSGPASTGGYSGPSFPGNFSIPAPVYTGQVGNPTGYPSSFGAGYNSIGNPPNPVNPANPGLLGLHLGSPDYSTGTTAQVQGSKVHSNLIGGSGFSMEDMKKLGGSGFSSFQSAPAEPVKVDLESKLMNLDNLEAGQSRHKEVVKSRW